ncbi:MAG: activase [Firmicutes bacterium]|nr:activase [Bacillota bacterium]
MDYIDELYAGIDVGSTTVKLVVADISSGEILFGKYIRHEAEQMNTVKKLLIKAGHSFPGRYAKCAVSGSGGRPIAEAMGVPYVQEVVANAAAVQTMYPQAGTAIELGGQDAKVIFFNHDEETGEWSVSDMRMNGSCAGGTGAFIEEVAAILDVPVGKFEALASDGETVLDISGRCGVFAKTDIQPLLIQGAKKEDIALSTFHAIAKQTIGGLAQGLELRPPIVFEGGPLTFNPTLIKVFAERLDLEEEEIIIPERPELMVALGTAISADSLATAKSRNREERIMSFKEAADLLEMNYDKFTKEDSASGNKLFASEEEKDTFISRHEKQKGRIEGWRNVDDSGKLDVYLGIDSGSTTSKFVLMDKEENIVDSFYGSNCGKPVEVVKEGITASFKKFKDAGIELNIIGVGTTGYGEMLFEKAFGADYHTVETVAHAKACLKYIPDTSFILDIGGQDMKAIWVNDGIITKIILNEACSSGCGSFLENFASTFGIEPGQIAEAAFRSEKPAQLGSRCTVFMNSTIINEQKNGRNADDIMAGLCRSIIENVFTKVVRISGVKELGNKVVVQGGTFRNLAVLRAIEEYLDMEVVRAPYPGEMGAIGAALGAKETMEEQWRKRKGSRFIGIAQVKKLTYDTRAGIKCKKCTNNCKRTIMEFSNGSRWISGNKCENGSDVKVRKKNATDLFAFREKLLMKTYPYEKVWEPDHGTIGIPRVLEFWESMPFWTTFFRALGFKVRLSEPGTQEMYEAGIQYVASDTVCFPAKLVHGHIESLARQNVDRIFMPYIMHMPPEGTDKLSPYVCSIIMGYPMVVNHSQKPGERYDTVFDTPIFHWFSEADRSKQICEYAEKELKVSPKAAIAAYWQAEDALMAFRDEMQEFGEKIIKQAEETGSFAVVLAGRPYHTDPQVSHNISAGFAEKGISVLTVDSLPGIKETVLTQARPEITNNFHTRMIAAVAIAAASPHLEYAQIVSFGCGHDAILSDEINRIMTEGGGKSPLIIKVDESDAIGSIGIRVQSFIETIKMRRKQQAADRSPAAVSSPEEVLKKADPYTTKYNKEDKKQRTLLIPNISEEVAKVMKTLLTDDGYTVKTVPVGGRREIALGKKYAHNDICFPCQMVIGELIAALQDGGYEQDEVAVGMIKFQCDCRLSHYAALLRKALDTAGYDKVPVLTTDVNDSKNMHPGVAMLGIKAVWNAVWIFMMMDILKEICRKIRPYEKNKGETDELFNASVDRLCEAIGNKGVGGAKKIFNDCIKQLCRIPYDRLELKQKVFITGELLVTYHPGSNFDIERYLEEHGVETAFPRLTDQLRKDFLSQTFHVSEFHAKVPKYPFLIDGFFDFVQKDLEKIAIKHPLYEKAPFPDELYEGVSDIIPGTLSCGEGWLMAADIVHHAKKGVKSFVVLQPFGCLPNHVCGRGVIKRIKEDFSDVQILPLDMDPDTSKANVESRLQMLMMRKLL